MLPPVRLSGGLSLLGDLPIRSGAPHPLDRMPVRSPRFFLNDGTNWSFAGFSGEMDRLFLNVNGNSDGNGNLSAVLHLDQDGECRPGTGGDNFGSVRVGCRSGAAGECEPRPFQHLFRGLLTYEVFSAPLPNGILSGAPPMFSAGNLSGGVIDQTTFIRVDFASQLDDSGGRRRQVSSDELLIADHCCPRSGQRRFFRRRRDSDLLDHVGTSRAGALEGRQVGIFGGGKGTR